MSRLVTLKHLQDYVQHHDIGNDALKKSIWQLTKSRHNSRNLTLESPFQADQLREELQARTRVTVFVPDINNDDDDDNNDKKNPALSEEHEKSTAQTTSPNATTATTPTTTTTFRLIDTLEEQTRNKENHPSTTTTTTTTATDTTQTDGLRQRKNKNATTTTTTTTSDEWTMVDHQNQQESLQQHDPIELFGGGLTPKELRVAQQKAKQALQSYIEAANHVAAILAKLPKPGQEGVL